MWGTCTTNLAGAVETWIDGTPTLISGVSALDYAIGPYPAKAYLTTSVRPEGQGSGFMQWNDSTSNYVAPPEDPPTKPLKLIIDSLRRPWIVDQVGYIWYYNGYGWLKAEGVAADIAQENNNFWISTAYGEIEKVKDQTRIHFE